MRLSEAEWWVMNLVWDTQPTEASAIIAHLADKHEWSDATIKTMLHRLVKKGALSAEPVGKKYRYSAAVDRASCVRSASRSFLDHVFGGDAAPALLHLVKASKLSAEQVAQLRKLLDSKNPKT